MRGHAPWGHAPRAQAEAGRAPHRFHGLGVHGHARAAASRGEHESRVHHASAVHHGARGGRRPHHAHGPPGLLALASSSSSPTCPTPHGAVVRGRGPVHGVLLGAHPGHHGHLLLLRAMHLRLVELVPHAQPGLMRVRLVDAVAHAPRARAAEVGRVARRVGPFHAHVVHLLLLLLHHVLLLLRRGHHPRVGGPLLPVGAPHHGLLLRHYRLLLLLLLLLGQQGLLLLPRHLAAHDQLAAVQEPVHLQRTLDLGELADLLRAVLELLGGQALVGHLVLRQVHVGHGDGPPGAHRVRVELVHAVHHGEPPPSGAHHPGAHHPLAAHGVAAAGPAGAHGGHGVARHARHGLLLLLLLLLLEVGVLLLHPLLHRVAHAPGTAHAAARGAAPHAVAGADHHAGASHVGSAHAGHAPHARFRLHGVARGAPPALPDFPLRLLQQ